MITIADRGKQLHTSHLLKLLDADIISMLMYLFEGAVRMPNEIPVHHSLIPRKKLL
jgi:hypothetical protein